MERVFNDDKINVFADIDGIKGRVKIVSEEKEVYLKFELYKSFRMKDEVSELLKHKTIFEIEMMLKPIGYTLLLLDDDLYVVVKNYKKAYMIFAAKDDLFTLIKNMKELSEKLNVKGILFEEITSSTNIEKEITLFEKLIEELNI